MIRLIGVHKRFSGRPVLAGVNLELPSGGVTFVVGRSGAGKSVLSRCCVGLMRVDAGEVHVDGERIDQWPERKLNELRRRVSYVVQGSALLDWMSLVDNVCVPLVRGLEIKPVEARERAHAALAKVGLSDLADRSPQEVGPGARKRASIARALALAPKAVLYDEPTTGLDPAAARGVDDVIRELANQGTTALVVSHDLASIERISDRVALLDEGVIAFHGPGTEFFAKREELPALKRFFRQGEVTSA
ncbi:MAG: ATP-binding cassette domain-containing protein [Myxococcales bacterium]